MKIFLGETDFEIDFANRTASYFKIMKCPVLNSLALFLKCPNAGKWVQPCSPVGLFRSSLRQSSRELSSKCFAQCSAITLGLKK